MADEIERIPIQDIRQEEGAHELASSPDMKPYLDFIKAVIRGHDPSPELETIRQLPLEKRYVWHRFRSKMGPRRLRQSQRRGRQADLDTRAIRQGDGAFEIPPDAACYCFEDLGGR